MNLTLYVWRQPGPAAPGRMERYEAADVNPDSSFLEMLDVLNERLAERGEDRIAFDHDCREGICGMCGFMINGEAHGPRRGTTVCQLHMRHFRDGDVLHLEPWRARAFPVVKDLMVDRRAFDYSDLDRWMAQADQAIRHTRRVLDTVAKGRLPAAASAVHVAMTGEGDLDSSAPSGEGQPA